MSSSKAGGDTLCVELEDIEQATGRLLNRELAGSVSAKYVFESGDVLFGRLRPYLRKWWYADRPGVCSTEIWPLVSDPLKVDNRFIYWLIQADTLYEAAQVSYGTHMPRADWKVVSEVPLPLPPLAEQRAIAAVLSDVDGLIGSLEALIEKKRAIKRAAMQQLLTGRTRLPGFEGEWGAGRLGDVAQLHRDHVMPSDEDHAGYEVFSLPAYDAGRSPSMEPSAAIQSGKFRVPRNAVLLSRLNPRIPRVWAPPSVGPNAIASTEFLVLTPRESAVRAFLFWLCSSPQFCDRMVAAVTGTTGSHQRVNRIDAMNLRIRVPPLPEQRAIANVLTDMDAEIAALERREAKTRAIKQGMMQQLLTGSIRLPIPDDGMEGESHDA